MTKDQAYELGLYVFEPPPEYHGNWTRADWIKYAQFTVDTTD